MMKASAQHSARVWGTSTPRAKMMTRLTQDAATKKRPFEVAFLTPKASAKEVTAMDQPVGFHALSSMPWIRNSHSSQDDPLVTALSLSPASSRHSTPVQPRRCLNWTTTDCEVHHDGRVWDEYVEQRAQYLEAEWSNSAFSTLPIDVPGFKQAPVVTPRTRIAKRSLQMTAAGWTSYEDVLGS